MPKNAKKRVGGSVGGSKNEHSKTVISEKQTKTA
jgi:hypothetical protein